MSTLDARLFDDPMDPGNPIPAIGNMAANVEGVADFMKAYQDLTAQAANSGEYRCWQALKDAAFKLDGGIHQGGDDQAFATFRSVLRFYVARFAQDVQTVEECASVEWRMASNSLKPLEHALAVYEDAIAHAPGYLALWISYLQFIQNHSNDQKLNFENLHRAILHVGNDPGSTELWTRLKDSARATGDQDRVANILALSAGAFTLTAGEDLQNLCQHLKQYPDAHIPANFSSPQQINQAYAAAGAPTDANGNAQHLPKARDQVIDFLSQEFTQRQHNNGAWRPDTWAARLQYYNQVKDIQWDAHGPSPDQQQLLLAYVNWSMGADPPAWTEYLFERFTLIAPTNELLWIAYATFTAIRTDISEPLRIEQRRCVYEKACVYPLPSAATAFRLQFAQFEIGQEEIESAYEFYTAILDKEPGNLGVIVSLINCAKLDTVQERISVLNYLEHRLAAWIDSEKSQQFSRLGIMTKALEKIAEAVTFTGLFDDQTSIKRGRALYARFEPDLRREKDYWTAKLTFEYRILTRFPQASGGDLASVRDCWSTAKALGDEEFSNEYKISVSTAFLALLRTFDSAVRPALAFRQIQLVEQDISQRELLVAASRPAAAPQIGGN